MQDAYNEAITTSNQYDFLLVGVHSNLQRLWNSKGSNSLDFYARNAQYGPNSVNGGQVLAY